MTQITKTVLKYKTPPEGSYKKGDMYVALDDMSGGCPYRVDAMRAHDFKSVMTAARYPGSDEFSIVNLTFVITERLVSS